MLFPFVDERSSTIKGRWITFFLVLVTIAIFLFSYSGSIDPELYVLYPSDILEGEFLSTLATYIFFHSSIFHLLFNIYFFWLFADNVEHNLGKFRFLVFYILVGALSALFYSLIVPDKDIALIGASGAISGVIGAYLVLYPSNKFRSILIFPPWIVKIVQISGSSLIILWFVVQLASAYIFQGSLYTYLVHIAGFLIGIAFALILRRNLVFKNLYQ